MPRLLIPIIMMLLTCLPLAGHAQEVVIVQSASYKPYEEAVGGFISEIATLSSSRGVKSIQPVAPTTYLLKKSQSTEDLNREIDTQGPHLILAVGDKAFSAVSSRKEPIIFLLAPKAGKLAKLPPNITGIRMAPCASEQLLEISTSLPKVKRVGTVFNPDKTGNMVEKAEKTAKDNGLELLASSTDNPRKVASLLDKMKGNIDAFWMLPDHSLINPVTLDLIILFSMENRIPVVTFASKYLRNGAAMAVFASPEDMGRQAADLSKKILTDGLGNNHVPEYAKRLKVMANKPILKKLGVEVNLE